MARKHVHFEPGGIRVSVPPSHGPGSSKEAWIAFAQELMEIVAEQTVVVRDMRHHIATMSAVHGQLLEQARTNKPKGGRARLPDDTVKQIEEALRAGHSTRQIGARYRVSAMTVSRVRKAMNSRVAQSA